MKTYLVTGGSGFIGCNFVKYLIKKYGKDINIIVLDKLTYAGDMNNLKECMEDIIFIKGDICDKELLYNIFKTTQIDYVVNFAAESHVDKSIENPQIFLKTNILGTQNLMEICKKFWSIGEDKYKDNVKFLQVSTDEVYGSTEEGYFTENTPINPRSPYSASKASADMIVNSYINTYNFPANITRCSNNYGPNQFPEKLIPLTIKNLLEDKNIPIYGDGKNVRDWLYVEDHCKAIDLVLDKGKIGEVYNIGGHNERENIEIVKLIIDKVREILEEEYKENINYEKIIFVKDRKGHDRRYAIDPSKIRKLGWKEENSFEENLEKTIRWYLKNQSWILKDR